MIGRIDPRKVARIARWELTETAGQVKGRTLVLALVGAMLALLVGPAVLSGGVTVDEGIYRVGVDERSRYHNVVEDDPKFVAVDVPDDALADGEMPESVDVLVRGTLVVHRSTPKGRAAYSAFRRSIQAHNDRAMQAAAERGSDPAAAFPVDVSVRFRSRVTVREVPGGGTGGGGGGDGGNGGGGGGGNGGGDGGGGGGGGPLGIPNLGGGNAEASEGTPSSIQPPFPFGSLVLAFLFIVPMNFVIQAYGSTIMDERINRRGELLLVSPVSRGDIIAGKTLPYFGTLLAISVGTAVLIGGGPLSVAAVVPIAALFLAATFVGAMFARSFKELTFVTLTISVFLTSYAFVPAIFTEITPIALISPLTLVVRDLQNTGVTLGEYAFSTGPFYLATTVLFALGAGVYREEDMFTQRSVRLKALDALAARIRRKRSVVLLSALSIPFVFVAELLAVALLFALPLQLSVPVLIVIIAGIEEVAKSAHLYAGFEHARFDRTDRVAVVVGSLSGVGFFLGEKGMIVAQVVGLPSLALGGAVVPEAAVGGPTAAALLLAPLLLHATTATISAFGARRGPRAYAVALVCAVVVHAAYNLGTLAVVGGV
ncbi:PrsW family intramembrane metalloprotease [Halobacteriales archaeon QS_8_69_26]|nr:MAG: PrsW family intramembrane metalloprotease [Halobacteriales archaeon QS_8_69_26]